LGTPIPQLSHNARDDWTSTATLPIRRERVQVDGQPPASGTAYANLPGLAGTQQAIVERLLAQRETNLVSYVIVVGTAIDAFAPIVARLAAT
jgi:hypothetical protein